MREHLPWLSQGDIFAEVPVATLKMSSAGDVSADFPRGPAVLLNHDCSMDKASKAGLPNIKTLHFAPLVAVDVQDPNRQKTLRENKLQPYEAMYLGNCGSFGESFIVLSQMYPLPMAFFAAQAVEYDGHEAATPGDRYCTPSRNGRRVGRLDDGQVGMLRSKINAFWTRLLPQE